MTEQEFSKKAKEIVFKHLTCYTKMDGNMAISKYRDLKIEDIYIVWECFILNNNKALLATPVEDDAYFEVTYDNNKNVLYLTEYKNIFNQEIYIEP